MEGKTKQIVMIIIVVAALGVAGVMFWRSSSEKQATGFAAGPTKKREVVSSSVDRTTVKTEARAPRTTKRESAEKYRGADRGPQETKKRHRGRRGGRGTKKQEVTPAM